MKIAIAELETPAEIRDLNYETGGAIVGGGTSGSTTIELGAVGEFTFTDAQTFSFTFEVPPELGGPGSLTLTGGFGIAADFPLQLRPS